MSDLASASGVALGHWTLCVCQGWSAVVCVFGREPVQDCGRGPEESPQRVWASSARRSRGARGTGRRPHARGAVPRLRGRYKRHSS
jgi:hypothetical protein